jgi:hypothetical protein
MICNTLKRRIEFRIRGVNLRFIAGFWARKAGTQSSGTTKSPFRGFPNGLEGDENP